MRQTGTAPGTFSSYLSISLTPNPHIVYSTIYTHSPQMSVPPTTSSSAAVAPRPPLYSASTLFQGNSSFGFQGIYPPYQPIEHDSKRENELKKRRVSDSRRQRTPMSCDRCKLRKIKVISFIRYSRTS